MSAAKEKAPTRQRQGFDVNHLESIHMGNTTVVQGGEQQLVRVFSGVIGGMPSQVCDGRELHAFLKNGKQFSDWIKHRISQYGFEENQDFRSFSPKSEKPQGGRRSTEYHLSLDMAKELSMVENNEQGRAARRYFIAMERERHVLASGNQSALPDPGHDLKRFVFRGRPVHFALIDGKPWACAGNLSAALNIGSSDRLTRSLPAERKRRIPRGATAVWVIDADAAMRAADYCRDGSGEDYRHWLTGVLSDLVGMHAAKAAPDLNTNSLACLGDALTTAVAPAEQLGITRLLNARLLSWFDADGKLQTKALDPDAVVLRRERLPILIADREWMPRESLPAIIQAVAERMRQLG